MTVINIETLQLSDITECTVKYKACPTLAIYEPNKLNPRRCIAFSAWFTQDGKPAGLTSHIPPEIREKMGTRVHGCDICQEVCPRNQAKLKAKLPDDEFLKEFDERRDGETYICPIPPDVKPAALR